MTAFRSRVAITVAVIAATLAVYSPVIRHDFINYDDPDYVTENQHVLSGLNWEGARWAFARMHGERTYWHPLTWISHMVDGQLFGLEPAGHHAMNVFFHALNAVLVFLVFLWLNDAFWRSATLAGLFAIHPLQVDTVAWVAERKNLLSTLFGLLAIWAYAAHAKKAAGQRPKAKVAGIPTKHPASRTPRHFSGFTFLVSPFYLFSLALFGLSLMSKPTLVTLPFLLLLLDYWPLNRVGPTSQNSTLKPLLSLVSEKLPFLLLATTSGVITMLAHHGLGMLQAGSSWPLGFRIENAFVSCAHYLASSLWPSKLAIFYPLPDAWPAWKVVVSGVLVLAFSALALATARRRPYLFVGWFWFVGVLVPFLGLIQVGAQAMADRFTYLPLAGLLLALVWSVAEFSRRWPYRTLILSGAVILLLLACATLSRRQLAHWQNSITVFEHALVVTTGNYVAHQNLAEALARKGRFAEAGLHFTAAIKLRPGIPELHYGLGQALLQQNHPREAVAEYREALRLRPNWAGVLNNLAWLLATHPSAEFRNGDEAISLAKRACQLTGSTNITMLATLAAAYAEAGRYPEAVATQNKACDLATALGPGSAMETFQQRLDLYRSGHAYHQP